MIKSLKSKNKEETLKVAKEKDYLQRKQLFDSLEICHEKLWRSEESGRMLSQG
jgi:hypothetical protein